MKIRPLGKEVPACIIEQIGTKRHCLQLKAVKESSDQGRVGTFLCDCGRIAKKLHKRWIDGKSKDCDCGAWRKGKAKEVGEPITRIPTQDEIQSGYNITELREVLSAKPPKGITMNTTGDSVVFTVPKSHPDLQGWVMHYILRTPPAASVL